MKIAVLGTGMVGRALAGRLAGLGHDVVIGTRNVAHTLARTVRDAMGTPPYAEYQEANSEVQLVPVAEAGAHGELVINATAGAVSLVALEAVGAANLAGKVLIDVALPQDLSKGMPPPLLFANNDSLGERIQRAFPGDVVWIPPGVKHCHGASPNSSMSHIAINENLGGKVVDWMEKVTDEQYTMTTNTTQPTTGPAGMQIRQPNVQGRRLSPNDVLSVAPALERYTQDRLYGEVWNRPTLTKRDRSIVNIAALIARGQTGALTYYFNQAINNGVKPSEISETITHLAYYSGWGNAFGAVGAAKEVFAQRGIGPDQLPPAIDDLLPIDEAAEVQRATQVEANFRSVAPGFVQYTTDALFRDLWLRPGLAPRDRSLMTVSALVASGQVAHITYHLNRAMDNGLTQEQAFEALTQLAFYAGWPNVFSALPVVKDVFEKRPK